MSEGVSAEPPRKKAKTTATAKATTAATATAPQKLEAPLQRLPGVLDEAWTVVTLPKATRTFEPINFAFDVRCQSDGEVIKFKLECIDYGLKRMSRSKGRTYVSGESNTRANLEWGGCAAHVYLDKKGCGRFCYIMQEKKIIIRRDPFHLYLYDPGP
jgi:hypothetical protein